MAHWNHRLVEHRNSKDPEHEVYMTVHEAYYADDGGIQGWAQGAASPQTREEAEQIASAFDEPPIAWVDDASIVEDNFGFDDYKVWGWMLDVKVASPEIEGW